MNKILNFKGDYKGLDSQTASENLLIYGYNSEIKQEGHRKFKFYGVFKSLRIYLMLTAVVLYFASDFVLQGGLLLFLTLGFCVFEIIIENYCDKKLKEFTDTSEVIVRVVRDGKIVLVKREELVQDDYIILQGGENVPADAHILESSNVTVDESIFGDSLTGEKVTVKKHPGSDGRHELKQSCVYKGTKVLTGILIARVFATGQDVKIRPKIRTTREVHRTRIESAINKFTTLLTYGAAILLVIVAVTNFILANNTEHESGLSALGYLAGIALPAVSFALCAVPVSIALMARIYYINGATALSASYGTVKSLRALEKLNSATAVCLDMNSIIVSDNTPVVAESTKNENMLSRIAALSCNVGNAALANPYEKAILVSAAFKRINTKELYQNNLIHSYVPEQESDYNKINGNLWEINGAHLLCVKGAPEVVLSFCKLPPEQLFAIQQKQSEYTKQGHQVLAVAFAKLDNEDDEDYENDYENDAEATAIPENIFDVEYTFLGLIAFSTSIRDNISEAVQKCYNAGVRVVMASPDADRAGGIETALAVARKAGIHEEDVIAGNKLDVTKTLISEGETVAVFGADSFDTETLELADIGIALGKHTTGQEWDGGTDTMSRFTTGSAYEACNLILNGDTSDGNGLAKAAGAFKASHQIHRNINRLITLVISTFAALLPFGLINLFIGDVYILEAVFISTLSIIIIPLLSLFFLNNEHDADEGAQTPAFDKSGGINKSLLINSAIQGAALFAALFVMFLVFRAIESQHSEPEEVAGMLRAIFLSVFTSGAITTAWLNSSREKPFYKVIAEAIASARETRRASTLLITAVLLLLLPLWIYLPTVNSAFGLGSVNPLVFVLALIVGMGSQVWFDFFKRRF